MVPSSVLDSIVVSIPACHAGDRGSIPRRGDYFLHAYFRELHVKSLSEVGFEPTPTFVDQNTHSATVLQRRFSLESGALDRSAILTDTCILILNQAYSQNTHSKGKIEFQRITTRESTTQLIGQTSLTVQFSYTYLIQKYLTVLKSYCQKWDSNPRPQKWTAT